MTAPQPALTALFVLQDLAVPVLLGWSVEHEATSTNAETDDSRLVVTAVDSPSAGLRFTGERAGRHVEQHLPASELPLEDYPRLRDRLADVLAQVRDAVVSP